VCVDKVGCQVTKSRFVLGVCAGGQLMCRPWLLTTNHFRRDQSRPETPSPICATVIPAVKLGVAKEDQFLFQLKAVISRLCQNHPGLELCTSLHHLYAQLDKQSMRITRCRWLIKFRAHMRPYLFGALCQRQHYVIQRVVVVSRGF
jgi:hypothetical protein